MPVFLAHCTVRGREAADALGAGMERLAPPPCGVGVFEIEDGSGMWEVSGYFDAAPDQAGLALLAAARGANPFTVSELPDTDWVAHAKRLLHPVEAGRFFVCGSHDAHLAPTRSERLIVDAATAFGTGHHGTTLGCLREIDRLAGEGWTPHATLDLGCGTGVLAMAAARVWPGETLASDADSVAVEVAAANVALNGLAARVRCVEASGLDHPQIAASAPFGLIAANLLKAPLIALRAAITGHLAPAGRAILSGILREQADEVAEAYASGGAALLRRSDIGDWATLLVEKSAVGAAGRNRGADP